MKNDLYKRYIVMMREWINKWLRRRLELKRHEIVKLEWQKTELERHLYELKKIKWIASQDLMVFERFFVMEEKYFKWKKLSTLRFR